MTQLDDIYSTRILELSANIGLVERLADPDGTATAHSKLCGSTVTVDLKLAGDRVSAYGQTVKACLLGQAAASVMSHHIIGSSARELREVAAARCAGCSRRAAARRPASGPISPCWSRSRT